MPCCRRKNIGCRIKGHLARIMWTLSVYDETERPDRTVDSLSRHPTGHIYRWFDHQFTPKQGVQACRDLFGRKPENHTLAAAAPIKSKHQSGLVSRPSKSRHPKAGRPVPPLNGGYATFDELTGRFPEQGAISKEPNVTLWRVRQDVVYCDDIIVIGHVDRAWSRPRILNHASGPSHKLRCERHLLNDSRHN